MGIYVFFFKKKKKYQESKDTYYYERGKGMGRQIICTFLVICVVRCYIYHIRPHQGVFPGSYIHRFSESGRVRFLLFLGAFFISIIRSSWSLSLLPVLGRVLRRSIKFVLLGFFYMWIAFL